MSSEDIGRPALGVCWALTTITLFIAIARLYTQARITHLLGLSDALLALSTCIVLTFASLISVQYHYGWGRHQSTLSDYDQMMALKFNSIGQSCGVMGSTCGRLSTIVLMMNLFAINPKVRRLMWGIFIAQIITNGVTVVCLYAQCTNVVLLWDKTGNVSGTCWNGDVQTYLGYGHSAFNGCTDLFLTFFPAYMISKLQMTRQTKIGVSILLGLSIIAFIAVMMKIVELKALSNRGDYTYNTVPLFTWVLAEACLLNIAASAPILRPLYRKMIGRPIGTKAYELQKQSYAYESRSHGSSRPQNTSRFDDARSDQDAILADEESRHSENSPYMIKVNHEYTVKRTSAA